MELILIRHAIAEERNENKPDNERELTGKGKKKFKKIIPCILHTIKDAKSVKIITSPSKRAYQTADILGREIKRAVPEVHSFIEEGEFTGLISYFQSCNEEDTIVVVGHEPALGDWSEKVSGVHIPFKKGACAFYKIKDKSCGTGTLQFYITARICDTSSENAHDASGICDTSSENAHDASGKNTISKQNCKGKRFNKQKLNT